MAISFFDITITCDIRVHRAGSQLKPTHLNHYTGSSNVVYPTYRNGISRGFCLVRILRKCLFDNWYSWSNLFRFLKLTAPVLKYRKTLNNAHLYFSPVLDTTIKLDQSSIELHRTLSGLHRALSGLQRALSDLQRTLSWKSSLQLERALCRPDSVLWNSIVLWSRVFYDLKLCWLLGNNSALEMYKYQIYPVRTEHSSTTF